MRELFSLGRSGKTWRLILLAVLLQLPSASMAQRMSAERDTVDLGKIAFRNPVTATFRLNNTGNVPIYIRKAETSCGCTQVTYPHHSVARGRNFVVNVTYDAKEMGHFEKYVALYPNASQKPHFLFIKGIVVSPELADKKEQKPHKYTAQERKNMAIAQATPSTLWLPTNNKKTKIKYTVVIKNAGGKMLELSSLEVPEEGVEARLSDKLVVPGKTEKLKVVIDRSVLGQSDDERVIRLTTNDSVTPVLKISIK